jgi:hypothetical protein
LPVTVTGIVFVVDPSEIEMVAVPAATAFTVNCPVEDPDLELGETLATVSDELEAENVPVKFVSVAVAVNEVVAVVPGMLIVCAALGDTPNEPAKTVICAVFVWLWSSVTVTEHVPAPAALIVNVALEFGPPLPVAVPAANDAIPLQLERLALNVPV